MGDFPYLIRRSRRASNVRIVVKPSGIELVVPLATCEADAVRFLEQKRDWITRKLSEAQGRASAQHSSIRPLLASGSVVPFRGVSTPVLIQKSHNQRLRVVKHDEGPFEVFSPADGPVEIDRHIRAALFGWIRPWMQRETLLISHECGATHNLHPREIRIKQMKSRWGSCGPRNDINLNWTLAFAPASALKYVVVHELSHIRHRNHSADFWALVSELMPEWRAERQWLKSQGGDLLWRFGS
jgi:predicted metal-dependent hydrolase